MPPALHTRPPSDDVLFSRTVESRGHLPELAAVQLTVSVMTDSGLSVMPGARGTIVAVLGEGESYLIELSEPEPAVVLVEGNGVAPIAQ